MTKYPELSPFTLAFADAYRGFMKEHRITGSALTEKLGRALGYVSERINGKRALDTEDVDALAMLAGGGWTGKTLMIELARRAQAEVEPVGELVEGRFRASDVPASQDDFGLAAYDDPDWQERQERDQEMP